MISIKNPREIIYFNTIKEVIYTHSNLSDDDKKYGINLINNLLDKNDLKEETYRFFLYANLKTFTGTYCGCYNDFFEDAIKKRNEKIIKNMVTEIKEEAFFELFDNKYITAEDKTKVLTTLNYELSATKEAINTAIIKNNIYTSILIGEQSLYETILRDFLAHNGFSVYSLYAKYIYLVDTVKNSKTPKIFYFDTWSLLNVILKENLNPQTLEPFSIQKYNQIKNRYDIELKLILRYLKTKKV